ncbi:unnamed protein product [Oreochromis niloticus]|nr:unnamed protein product [Mustela putorius furo]
MSSQKQFTSMYVMEEIHDIQTPLTNHTGQRNSKSRLYLVVILSLGLVAGVLTAVFFCDNQISSMTEERDLLHTKLTEKSEELERLQSLFKQNKPCPVGWSSFSDSCYLLSESSGSWDAARKDCRDRGADLVVIECTEEQTFLSTITTENAWIGLNDKEQEGTWKWVDGTPLTLTYWARAEPDNGGEQDCAYNFVSTITIAEVWIGLNDKEQEGTWKWVDGTPLNLTYWARGQPDNGGEQDCAHVRSDKQKSWNDLRCSYSYQWICEKVPENN